MNVKHPVHKMVLRLRSVSFSSRFISQIWPFFLDCRSFLTSSSKTASELRDFQLLPCEVINWFKSV